jgi:hypothetical protein
MTRVCTSLGTWQLIMLVAALHQASRDYDYKVKEKEHILVLYGQGLSKSLKYLMIEVANLLWDWDQIVWADDLLYQFGDNRQSSLKIISTALKERLDLDSANEIWVCKLAEPPEKHLVEIFNRAEIVFYEDGLHSYVPRAPFHWNILKPISYPRITLRAIHHWLFDDKKPENRTQNVWISKHHLRRLRRAYLYIGQNVPIPPPLNRIPHIHFIKNDILRNTIIQCYDTLIYNHINAEQSMNKKKVLFLGQCFSKWNIIERNIELNLYSEAIEYLISKGYYVIYKEHPRIDRPFFKDLTKIHTKQFKKLNIPTGLPVELVIHDFNDIQVVGATTSALLYWPHLFGIKSFTCAQIFQPYIKDPDFKYMVKIITEKVLPLTQIL